MTGWSVGRIHSHVDRDLFQRNQELIQLRYLDVQRDRVALCQRELDQAGYGGPYLDQYPAKRKPAMYTRMFGPFGMQAARRDTTTSGFELLAPLVTPSQFAVPRTSNVLTGREKLFYLTRINITCFMSWTYVTDPGFNAPIDPRDPADIFDPVIGSNGGASLLLNHSGTGFDAAPQPPPSAGAAPVSYFAPRACFEFELYDKRRGRALTDGPVSGELIAGGAFDNKMLSGMARKGINHGYRFDADTELEPRLYITEIRPGSALEPTLYANPANTAFNAARVKVWFQIGMVGYQQYAIEKDGLWHELAGPTTGFNAPPRRS